MKPTHHYSRWTSEDMDRLEDFYRKSYTALKIGQELGRSPDAIYSAAARLNLCTPSTGRNTPKSAKADPWRDTPRADKVEIAARILRDIFGVGE